MKIIKDDLSQIISDILNLDYDIIQQIDEDKNFEEHGLTSVSVIQLVVMIELKYGIEIRYEDLHINKLNTFNKLICLLENY